MNEPPLRESPALGARLDVIARRLDEVTARYERARDSRCVFSYAYAMMTRRIRDNLPSSGVADPEWIVTLAEEFSSLYFDALDASDQKRPLSMAWEKVFVTIGARRTSVLEDLVFGMTAHIVHDLPLALTRAGLSAGGSSRIHDFHVVNELMKDAIDPMQVATARRYGGFGRWLDRMLEEHDEIVTDYGLRMSRGLAWYNAERLLDPASTESAAAAIERSPILVVDTVMHPPLWSFRILLRASRRLAGLLRRWPRPAPEVGELPSR